MTNTTILADIISRAAAHNLPVTVSGDEVHVTMTGTNGIIFRHDVIEAGATYLGQFPCRMAPMGFPQVTVARFTA